MCGRATLSNQDFEEIATEIDAEFSPDDARLFRKRYNIAPSDLHWIVAAGADRRVLIPAIWGYLAGGRSLINVRGEQVGSGHGFREAFAARRCLVVTDGFFEWNKQKSPHWYHRADGRLVLLAGLSQPPASRTGVAARSHFTILTTRPNRLVAQVHDRMPVIVAPATIDEWLTADPAQAATLIKPAADDALVVTRVSRRVNSVKNDDPDCLRPVDAAEADSPPAQGRLF
jgi:putative SOS response-associated peptidase YedK